MAKEKRKLSAYNKHMQREMKKGKTFKQAVSSWKKGGSKSKPKSKRSIRARVTSARKSVSKGGRKVARGFNQQKLFKIARMAALLGPHAAVWLSSAEPMEKAAESVRLLSGFDMNTGQFNFQKLIQGYGPLLATTGVTAVIPKINGIIKGLI